MTLTVEIAPEIQTTLEVVRTMKAATRRHASGFGKFAGSGVTMNKVHAAKREEIAIEEAREAQRNAQRGAL